MPHCSTQFRTFALLLLLFLLLGIVVVSQMCPLLGGAATCMITRDEGARREVVRNTTRAGQACPLVAKA